MAFDYGVFGQRVGEGFAATGRVTADAILEFKRQQEEKKRLEEGAKLRDLQTKQAELGIAEATRKEQEAKDKYALQTEARSKVQNLYKADAADTQTANELQGILYPGQELPPVAAGPTVTSARAAGIPAMSEYSPEAKGLMEDLSAQEKAAQENALLKSQAEASAKKAAEDLRRWEEQQRLAREKFEFDKGKANEPKTPKPTTVGGIDIRPMSDTERNKIQQTLQTAYTLDQISEAAKTISDQKRGPIVGRILGKNPYDVELKRLENLVESVVPSMARGIFAEVGVLTDKDVDRYRKLLADVKKDPKVATQIMQDINNKVNSAYNILVKTGKMSGRDMSEFEGYDDAFKLMRSIYSPKKDEPPSATGQTNAASDLELIRQRRAQKAGK